MISVKYLLYEHQLYTYNILNLFPDKFIYVQMNSRMLHKKNKLLLSKEVTTCQSIRDLVLNCN